MVYTAIVVEDQFYVLKQQKKLLSSIKNIDLKAGFLKASEALVFLKEKGPVDIIFSDIEMGEYSGLDLASELSKHTDFLVFITGHDQYTKEAFDVGAGGYLLKPVSEQDIQLKLDQFTKWRIRKERKPILSKTINVWDGTKRMMKIINLSEVISMVKNGNYIDIETEEGIWMALETMKIAEARFCHTGMFIRVNQSVIVAIQSIDRVQEMRIVHLANGTQYNLSKGYRNSFLEEFGSGMF